MSISIYFTNSDISSFTSSIVRAEATMPISTFYKEPGDSLINFKVINNEIYSEINSSFTTSVSYVQNAFNDVINSSLIIKDTVPFSKYNYTTFSNYLNCPSFGDLVLKTYGHYLFNNMTMTSLITNGNSIISSMNGCDPGQACIATGLASTIMNMPSSITTHITEQIITQDNSRIPADSTVWNSLEFKTGDTVYFTLSVSVSSVTAGPGQQYIPDKSNCQNIKYHIATLLT